MSEQLIEVYRRTFPSYKLTDSERAFLATIHTQRSAGTGYGWMRQAIGMAWKVADQYGYMDDDRLVELHFHTLRTALRSLAEAAEAMASSKPDMPSHELTCRRFDDALNAARKVA
jgi:hypothetical protein